MAKEFNTAGKKIKKLMNDLETGKMAKEFKLDEKECYDAFGRFYYWKGKDIKEFIKRRNMLVWKLHNGNITWEKFLKERDKLAGLKLL